MTHKMRQVIEDIINDWFELTVIRNKDLTLQYKIHNPYLEVQCKKLYQKYGNNQAYNSFVSNYIYHIYEALLKVEDFSDLDNVSRQVFTRVQFSIMEENSLLNSTRIKVDGRRMPLVFSTVSLDGFLDGEDYTEVSLLSMLTDESNLFNNLNNQIYFNSHFKRWFKENKETFLTESQIEFLDKLNSLPANPTYKQIKEDTGTDPRNMNDKLNRIADRTIKTYKEQKKSPVSQYQKNLTQLVKILAHTKNLSNRDTELDTLNTDLFDYLTLHFEQLQPYLNLTLQEHQAMNRREFNTQRVYKVTNQCRELFTKYNNSLNELVKNKHTLKPNYKPSLRQPPHNLPKDTQTALIVNSDGQIAPKKPK